MERAMPITDEIEALAAPPGPPATPAQELRLALTRKYLHDAREDAFVQTQIAAYVQHDNRATLIGSVCKHVSDLLGSILFFAAAQNEKMRQQPEASTVFECKTQRLLSPRCTAENAQSGMPASSDGTSVVNTAPTTEEPEAEEHVGRDSFCE